METGALDPAAVLDPGEGRRRVEPPAPDQSLWRQVAVDLRWAFTPPFGWFSGIGVNLALAFLWLVVEPLRSMPHRDWAILVGSYFAVWVLSDVTTTNVLGADVTRVRIGLLRGVPLRRVLLIKNLSLLVVVGVPTAIATGLITVFSEEDYRLAITLPAVAVPILTWLGVGNLVSVVFPVAAASLRSRWQQRHDRRSTLRWLVHLALPYVILVAVDPLKTLPRLIVNGLPRTGNPLVVRVVVMVAVGGAFWSAGSAVALAVARRRAVRFDDRGR